MSTKTKTTREEYAELIQLHYIAVDELGDDVITTEDIQELAVNSGVDWQSVSSINLMLTDFGYKSVPIKNNPERVWLIKGK
jgi:hypothetical protein